MTGAERSWASLLRFLWKRKRQFIYRVDSQAASSIDGSDLRVVVLTAINELRDWAYVKAMTQSSLVARRLSRGDVLNVGVVNGQAVHFAWLAAGRHSGRNMGGHQTRDSDVVIYDCLTPEEFRGRGYYPMVLKQIVNSHFKNEVAGRIFIACDPENTPSQKGILKSGFKKIGVQSFIKVLGSFYIHSKFISDDL